MADYNNIALNTTAERIERIANMEINTENIDEYSDDYSLPTSKAVYRAIVSSGGGVASGDYVSYSEEQNLTDEQKETARQNIGVFSQDTVAQMIIGSFEKAVPKSLVVDNLVADKQLLTDHIPNGQAVQSFIVANSVSSAVAQTLSDSKKQIARTNIGAISQAELNEAIANAGGSGTSEVWETIADITLAEVTNGIAASQDINGQAFSLKKAKIIVDTDNTSGFYTATGNLLLNLKSAETNVFSRAMYLENALPKTAGRYGRAVFEIEVISGLAFVSGRCSGNLKKLANTEFGDSFSFFANLLFLLENGTLNEIKIGTNYSSGLAAGTRLQVLGVRA